MLSVQFTEEQISNILSLSDDEVKQIAEHLRTNYNAQEIADFKVVLTKLSITLK